MRQQRGTRLGRRVALVTGGSRGLGSAIVHALARGGADVAFCYLRDTAAAETVADKVERCTGRRPLGVQADITVEADRRHLVETVVRGLGHPDVLVNNAGTKEDGVAIRMGDGWDRVVALDLTAPFRMTQLAVRAMLRNSWGRVVNIGSIASRIGLEGQANYTAAKAGLEGLTRSLAQEYGKRGITVNTVNPGFLETDLTEDASEEVKGEILRRSALRRFPTAREVADVVAFVASDAASGLTGQTLNVDGGYVKL